MAIRIIKRLLLFARQTLYDFRLRIGRNGVFTFGYERQIKIIARFDFFTVIFARYRRVARQTDIHRRRVVHNELSAFM